MLGSITEELINRTIEWYDTEGIALFRKSYPSTAILNKYTKTECISRFRDKGDVDYYGVYKGRYISFEVKETSKDFFLLSQIKPHQLEILLRLKRCGAISFLVLNFISYTDSCYSVDIDTLEDLFKNNKKKITYEEVSLLGRHIPVSFPGILDFLKDL